MLKTPPSFSSDDYEARVKRLKKSMEARSIDVLIVSDPANIAYLCGYTAWSFSVHQALVIALNAQPIWWGRAWDAGDAAKISHIKPDQVFGYPDHFVASSEHHPMEHLAATMIEHGWEQKTIGVEKDCFYLSSKACEVLQFKLSEARFHDATSLVNRLRLVKSQGELDCMRCAAEITELMQMAVVDRIAPGMRKSDLAAEVARVALFGTKDFGGDYAAIQPLMPSAGEKSAPHVNWGTERLASEGITLVELAGCYRRYHVPLARPFYFGHPSKAIGRAADALTGALDAAIATARAGEQACEVARVVTAKLERHGFDHSDRRIGYPVGLAFPPDWSEEALSLRKTDETVLKPNMTLHICPSLWNDDVRMFLSETVVIGKKGAASCMTDFPRRLFVK